MRVEYEDPRAYAHVMVQGVVLDKHVSDSFYNYIVLRDDGFIDEVGAVECKVIGAGCKRGGETVDAG